MFSINNNCFITICLQANQHIKYGLMEFILVYDVTF